MSRGEINAKEEFLGHVKDSKIKCCRVCGDDTYNYDTKSWDDTDIRILKVAHSKSEYNDFLESLNYVYDSGFGGQNLFGIIWYTDGTWSERCEYDGSEWWEYRQVPEIPDSLLEL